MTLDGEYVAVLDRFEDDLAVLLIEEGEETVGELAVPRSELPADACHQDAILQVSLQNGTLVDVDYDEDETRQRSRDAQGRFDRLARRPPDEGSVDSEQDDQNESCDQDESDE